MILDYPIKSHNVPHLRQNHNLKSNTYSHNIKNNLGQKEQICGISVTYLKQDRSLRHANLRGRDFRGGYLYWKGSLGS